MDIKKNIHDDDLLFHAGTKMVDGSLRAVGGRVLNVVGFGKDLKGAILDAYEIANRIEFKNKYFRNDIGKKGLEYK